MDDRFAFIEGEARFLLAGFHGVPGARQLARHHLGHARILVLPMKGRDSELVSVYGKPTIVLRPKLDKVKQRERILHELAEWHLKRIGTHDEDVEDLAHALAAALAAPRDAFRERVRKQGRDLPQLAFDFTITESSVVLRLGETDCVEASALVTTTSVRVRARADFVLPDLRKVAAEGHPLLERHVLTDARRRVGILVA
jgi:hypothetical protein